MSTENLQQLNIMNSLADDTLIDSKTFAQLIGVQEATIANWVCTGRYRIPFVKIGRLRKHRMKDVREILQNGLQKV